MKRGHRGYCKNYKGEVIGISKAKVPEIENKVLECISEKIM